MWRYLAYAMIVVAIIFQLAQLAIILGLWL